MRNLYWFTCSDITFSLCSHMAFPSSMCRGGIESNSVLSCVSSYQDTILLSQLHPHDLIQPYSYCLRCPMFTYSHTGGFGPQHSSFGKDTQSGHSRCYSCKLQILISHVFFIIHFKLYDDFPFVISSWLISCLYVPWFSNIEDFLVIFLFLLSSFLPVWSETIPCDLNICYLWDLPLLTSLW